MFIVNFKENTPQQRFYNVGVIGDSKSHKIQFIIQKQQEDVDLSLLVPYLKVENKEHEYYDKIELDKTSDDNFLYLVWDITRKSTHYRTLDLQIAFENSGSEDIVWQTMMFQIELGETIETDEKISEEYPSVIEQLEKEVHTFDDRLENVEEGLEELDESAIKKTDVVDNLESEATDKPLSANQGRLLNVKINNLIGSVYKPQGSITIDSLNALDTSLLENGYVYNMLDSGIITLGNVKVMEGDNVAWIIENGVGHWDKLSGLVDLSNYPTLDGDNTFTGTNTLIGNTVLINNARIKYGNSYRVGYSIGNRGDGYLQILNNNNSPIYDFDNLGFINRENKDLGSSSYTWKDLYLSENAYVRGIYPIGNTNNGITFTSSSFTWNINGNFAPLSDDTRSLGSSNVRWKDGYFSGNVYAQNTFNVINASDIVSNTLTQAQYDLITNGKPTLIKGTLLGNPNPLIWGLLDNGIYGWKAIFVGVDYLCAIEFPKSAPYTLSRRTNWNASGIRLGRISQINEKDIPSNPSNTGTFVNKMIDGTWSWKALGSYVADNTITELTYDDISVISISADTTFTLKTPASNSMPEYKANITNSGASAINITLPSGTTIKTNDDNIVIASNVMTLPSGITIELNIQDNNAIAFNWGA